MQGIIGFKGYLVNCIIGVEPHERVHKQNLLIDLKVEADFSLVSITDKLEDTINYISLAALCQEMALNGKYLMVEKYASDVIKEILTQFPVKSAWIRVKKPSAIPNAECALVEFKRVRQL